MAASKALGQPQPLPRSWDDDRCIKEGRRRATGPALRRAVALHVAQVVRGGCPAVRTGSRCKPPLARGRGFHGGARTVGLGLHRQRGRVPPRPHSQLPHRCRLQQGSHSLWGRKRHPLAADAYPQHKLAAGGYDGLDLDTLDLRTVSGFATSATHAPSPSYDTLTASGCRYIAVSAAGVGLPGSGQRAEAEIASMMCSSGDSPLRVALRGTGGRCLDRNSPRAADGDPAPTVAARNCSEDRSGGQGWVLLEVDAGAIAIATGNRLEDSHVRCLGVSQRSGCAAVLLRHRAAEAAFTAPRASECTSAPSPCRSGAGSRTRCSFATRTVGSALRYRCPPWPQTTPTGGVGASRCHWPRLRRLCGLHPATRPEHQS